MPLLSTYYASIGIKVKVEHNFYKSMGCYINDSLYANYTETSLNFRQPYIFTANYDGSKLSNTSMKLYNLQITDNQTLVRDYVPCYSTTTVTAYKGSTATTAAAGTIGLYDLVNSRFYINSGSGTFTKGPDV